MPNFFLFDKPLMPLQLSSIILSLYFFPKERITPSSARIFALWITLPAFLLILIAILFLRNQTRPIVNLAKAAERFGKGDYIEEFRPSGALEIRQAGHEFDRMRKRITRHLNQRSEMLSGISHDLRTPLTRLKLQLSFLKDKVISKKMANDIDDMEKMLNDYLQFASSSSIEKTETFNISELLTLTIDKYENKNISTKIQNMIYFDGRKSLIQRCLNNVIDNAIKFLHLSMCIWENVKGLLLTRKSTKIHVNTPQSVPVIVVTSC